MEKEIVIISVGGSLIVPNEIDIGFLKKFRNVILKFLDKKKFFVYVGGGKTARRYQKAMAEFKANTRQLDLVGIQTTRINAQLLKLLFGNLCHPEIIEDPTKKIKVKKDILIAAGWKPGWSTDYDAVLLAKNFGIKRIVNLTDVDYVFDKDPDKFPEAKPFKKMSWLQFKKIFGEKWSPGLSLPFDPVAAKIARELKMEVVIINGKKLKRLENFFNKKSFIGTIIS